MSNILESVKVLHVIRAINIADCEIKRKSTILERLSALQAGKTYLSIYGRGVFVFNYDDDSKNFVLMSHSVPRLVHLFYTISHIYSNIHVTIT